MLRRPFKSFRRRRTVKQQRRMMGLWRILRALVLLALLAGVGYAVYQYLTQSQRFKIGTIRIIGANILQEEEILQASGITVEDTLLSVEPIIVAQRVQGIPFVKTCNVKRLAPDTIVIEVQERSAAAAVMINNHLYEVDGEGMVLREINSMDDHPGPMISNLPDLNFAQPGQAISQRELGMALELWKAFSEYPVAKQLNVSELGAQSTEHIAMICDEVPFEIRWGYSDVAEQAKKLNTLWESQKGVFPCQEYLDLRFGSDIPCK